ncbi:hypothetical protein [Hyphomonas sp.]|uniref:hypothetical protein n=1 Tax=Hyphomonas sp. TaxID=87 RepID=UPI000C8D81AB|nr:hypothetical protein [Hyphomonas sp.]MAL44253.1 hypothetical protein [Hyphomonas sp.]
MLEAKFDRLHDEYADTIIAEVDDKSRDIQSDLEYELEAQLSDGIDEKYSNDITSAVREYADDILPDMVREGIDDTDEFTNLPDALADVSDLQDRVNDIEATQEASLEPELNHDVDVLKTKVSHIESTLENSIEQETEAEVVILKSDIYELQNKVEALENFIDIVVDKLSWYFDEVESSSDRLKDIAILTNKDISNALNEFKGEK